MFHKAIKEALKNKGCTQTWLARKTGIPKRSLWFYLREGRSMGVARVEEIFKFLGIELKVPKD